MLTIGTAGKDQNRSRGTMFATAKDERGASDHVGIACDAGTDEQRQDGVLEYDDRMLGQLSVLMGWQRYHGIGSRSSAYGIISSYDPKR